MIKNYSQLFIGIVIGLLIGLLIAKKVFIGNTNTIPQPTVQNNNTNNNRYPKNNNNTNNNNNNTNSDNSNTAIPAKVFTVLQYIKANNHAMDGYVGGRVFTNREGNLPIEDAQGTSIDYQEWDVNEKIQGRNRGSERICTGSDGRSWYTNDHYRTFTEIK